MSINGIKPISTSSKWEDLVLPGIVLKQVRELETLMSKGPGFPEDASLTKGTRSILFHGPSGTGKTFTATLLGKSANKDIYRVKLSKVVSKYIGETEKNLSKIFEKARDGDAILFFDEADALFGKRTEVKDAHDRYANQEVSYLLQQVEQHPGWVIFAAQTKNNLDAAFLRRMGFVIAFPPPKAKERFEIWRKNFPKQLELDPKTDLRQIADQYELKPGTIVAALQQASLKAFVQGEHTLHKQELEAAIALAVQKDKK
ncbi:ATP-binding protein [Pararhodonellum marinum]|uniref:ATP-binding protein n=1 Tax=Pararhodonellum marinum TaxID=2755358 RepID=UPI00188EAE9A|nr:ATP-binding protein [Pararhodonellum marinum]